MDFEVKVQNLGKISDSTIFVKPLTIITGSNASGKSFFTKTLYSIINILNQNLFKPTVLKDLRMLDSLLDFLESEIPYKGKRDTTEINDLRIISNSLQDNIFELSDFELEGFFSSSKELSKKIKDFQNKISIIEKRLNESARKSSETVSKILDTLKFRAERINEMILGSENAYTDFIKESIDKDLNLNFQISNSSELISFDKSFAKVQISNFLTYTLFDDKTELELNFKSKLMKDVFSLSQVVFFESPAYWRVREALIDRKRGQRITYPFSNRVLSGVPEYFYELDTLLNNEYTEPTEKHFPDLIKKLEDTLKGKFKFNDGKVSFIDNNSSRTITKNLISFGMTNLGMIHALLEKGIITKGSFVFIDEPESNLHPEWQVILADVLISLAENGVYVITTTHSADMLKAFDIITKERKLENNFLSISYFQDNGSLLNMEESDLSSIEQARMKLLEPYEDLLFRGYAL
ncbi:hypothetical protein A9299_05510 [Moraxella osloensis]|uniref:ATPase AAA-type core domain-containing protein n=1 Tax=Faucicola osloensis TaxID=34062 RepID=A0AA91FIU1_FAUOS|nr:AAA family ATPase [Moraxella osloensis]OBX60866.1 hypothetical protein A9299_05510 [Moraxella osloensis]